MKLFTEIRCELMKGKRVSLKSSVAIHFMPGFIAGDSLIDTVSMIIIGMIKYRYSRGQRRHFIISSKVCTMS